MIALPLFAKRCFFAVTFIWFVSVLPLVAGELSFKATESDNVSASIIMSSESTGQATISAGEFHPGVKIVGADTDPSGIRLVAPTKPKPSSNKRPKSAVPQKIHRVEPITVKISESEQGNVELTGAAPDQSLRTIQLLSALSDEWGRKSKKSSSPFREEPVRTAPEPKKNVEQPETKPVVQPETGSEPKRRIPAPIESGPAPIETLEPAKLLQPNDNLNDDLPYYHYNKSSGGKEAGLFRMSKGRLRDRLFHGPLRQKMMECQTGQCPTGDPWGPGHWVGPGVWMPDRSAQRPPEMSAGPVYCDELPCDAVDGTYGWEAPRRLVAPRFLADRGITLGGWIDQGITYNASNPADRYNGPVTFNDRSGDYQMNQVDVFLEREVDGSESGLEMGGRVDALFGTDARFTAADGWETNWDMSERFYRLSVPQMYADFGWRDWTVRMGHFYTTIGYESVPAVNNFFYSHSYSMQYGEPFTHTGMLVFRRINSRLKVNAGFHRGWDQFNGIYDCDRMSVLTGANWRSRNGRLKFDFALTAGPQGPDNSTVMYSMVGTYLPRGWLELVVQHDYGQSTGGNPHGIRMAEWYSVGQYAFITLNERWKVGARVECFCDKQGVRVHGLGQGNLAAGPYPGDFWEVTLGLNWEPHRNVRIRPEVRWDWYSATGATVNRPFDCGDSSKQFLLGIDAIVQF